MAAKHAVLGMLLHRPAYPYELADRLERRLGPAWAVNSGQLSQIIAKLEEDGLIERIEGPVGRRADRHVFAITDDGVAEFERWFDEDVGSVRLPRRPLLVKITFAGAERLEGALKQIDAYEAARAAHLEDLSRTHAAIDIGEPLVRADHVLLRLNLSADIIQLEGELKWAKQAREMLSWLLERRVVWPSVRERPYASDETHNARGVRRELFAKLADSDEEAANKQKPRVVGGEG
jgi:DNA-binding PadR family transcriptional regulator